MEQKIHRDIFLTDFPKNWSLNTKDIFITSYSSRKIISKGLVRMRVNGQEKEAWKNISEKGHLTWQSNSKNTMQTTIVTSYRRQCLNLRISLFIYGCITQTICFHFQDMIFIGSGFWKLTFTKIPQISLRSVMRNNVMLPVMLRLCKVMNVCSKTKQLNVIKC